MSNFYAMILRMKHSDRWGLMRNTWKENLSVHALDVAVLVHALCLIGNERFGKHYDAEHAAVLALFHDASEILTGDLPTPIKYYNPEIRTAYHQVERVANRQLVELLPDDLQKAYRPLFLTEEEDPELLKLLKAADRLSAIIKCIEEENAGNREFMGAKEAQMQALTEMHLPEVDVFLSEFLGAFSKTLDEQSHSL